MRILIAVLMMASVPVDGFAAPPHYNHWDTFGTADGLPSDKVMSVCATDDAVWVGTDRGLARYRAGRWTTLTTDDGLVHPAVMSIAEDPATGDVWIGTLGGMSRYSAGRLDSFKQLSSGLVNDVVYGVAVHRGAVWAATAAGTSRYEIAKDRWTIFNQTNTPMHEIWCYSVTGADDKVYVGVWGGGLLEYDMARNRWRDYRDPDGEMEIDLFKDDGLVHDIIASVTYDGSGRIWAGTYFGLSSYDGRKWRNFMDHDTPLLSNFVNVCRAKGTYCWIGTDDGLNASDRDNWWSYRRDEKSGRTVVTWTPAGGAAERFTTETAFPHNYILGVDFQGDDIWLATEKGVARGTLSMGTTADAGARASVSHPSDSGRTESITKLR